MPVLFIALDSRRFGIGSCMSELPTSQVVDPSHSASPSINSSGGHRVKVLHVISAWGLTGEGWRVTLI